jgi:hypothetical protein
LARNIVHGLAFQQGQLSNSASRCLFLTISRPRRVGAALSHSPTTRVWRRHLSHVAGNVRPVLGLLTPCLSHVLCVLASPGIQCAFLNHGLPAPSFLTHLSQRAALLKHTLPIHSPLPQLPPSESHPTKYSPTVAQKLPQCRVYLDPRFCRYPLSHASASTVRRVSSPTTTFPQHANHFFVLRHCKTLIYRQVHYTCSSHP